MNENRIIITCPHCGQRYGVPNINAPIEITCRVCNKIFYCDPQHILSKKPDIPTKKKNHKKIAFSIMAIFLIFTAISSHFLYKKKQSRWINIEYRGLLDLSKITHSGFALGELINDTTYNSEIQPFVDRFSFLLQHSIEILNGRDVTPMIDITSEFPIGVKQPAWVALLRNGKIRITTNYNGYARVFLLGRDPRVLYYEYYPIIRHCLKYLLLLNNSPIIVQIYAYENSYSTSTLSLNPKPYSIKASDFPSPPNKVSLDLDGLNEFFNRSAMLEAAKLDKKNGLLLYATKSTNQTLAGFNISLADFVVAYRAIFHSGYNAPYISLDKHKDPTKVAVNFGGFLEDTHIGSVVLDADKRFKTITCGLDPNNNKDIRKQIRMNIPSFMTSEERDLLTENFDANTNKWIKTRFWFYPDSIEVFTDSSYTYAKIIRPFFVADAERSRDDFRSMEEFEKKKKELLPTSIQTNINHINKYYMEYAKLFPEFNELLTVGRFMGICTWLLNANPKWLDLDALLSIELPEYTTPREKSQLLSTSILPVYNVPNLTMSYIANKTIIHYLTHILNQSISKYFVSPIGLAKFYCYRNNEKEDRYPRYLSLARTLINKPNTKVSNLITNERDLEMFVVYASDKIKIPFEDRLNNLEYQINKYESIIDSEENDYWKLIYIDKYNKLVDLYNKLLSMVIKYKECKAIMHIGGGIDLAPNQFRVVKVPRSPRFESAIQIMEKTESQWQKSSEGTEWIRNKVNKKLLEVTEEEKEFIKDRFKDIVENIIDTVLSDILKNKSIIHTEDNNSYVYLTNNQFQYWCSYTLDQKRWIDFIKLANNVSTERLYDANEKIIEVNEWYGSENTSSIIGIQKNGRIIFTKKSGSSSSRPESPAWWK